MQENLRFKKRHHVLLLPKITMTKTNESRALNFAKQNKIGAVILL